MADEFEFECPACKRRTKLSRREDEEDVPSCQNLECSRFGKPMRELV